MSKTVINNLNVAGTINLRDLGGVQTKDGQMVKKGMLYRSGNLSRLTEAGEATLKELGIKKICDLRGIDETNKYPDPMMDGVAWFHTPLLAEEAALGNAGDHSSFVQELRNSKPGELLISLNKKMVHYKSSFQQVFKVLLTEPEKPFLFHCMAGKDRTGAIAALILSILGVSRESILQDYLFTNDASGDINTHFDEIGYNDLPNVDVAVLDALFEARVEYITTFLDEIDKHYGSIDNYTKEVLELSDEEIVLLKENLLQ
ncbi:tyrosine-protein phosphatase [Sutcliffiella cohnii]